MNKKLSVYTNKPCGLSGFVLCSKGDLLEVNVSKLHSDNIKADVLEKLARGLRMCRKYVSHDDILYIEIQNQHLCNWLSGKVEYKEYSEGLDAVFSVLETLDCKYSFVFVKSPIAKIYVQNGKTDFDAESALDVLSKI